MLCTNHANGVWRSGYVPPLLGDLVAVTSEAVLEVYARHSPGKLNAVLIPQSSPQRPMRSRIDPGQRVTVGIFLTALTNMQRLRALVGRLEGDARVARVLIRSHPVKVVREDISVLTARDARVADSSAIPLFENIELCDVVICGNSSVTIDILRGGVPVLYDAGLDDVGFDRNGYLERGLVPRLPADLHDATLAAMDRFYSAPAWARTMQHFDAGYGQDEAAMRQRLHDAVRALVPAQESSEARGRPQDAATDAPVPAPAA